MLEHGPRSRSCNLQYEHVHLAVGLLTVIKHTKTQATQFKSDVHCDQKRASRWDRRDSE